MYVQKCIHSNGAPYHYKAKYNSDAMFHPHHELLLSQ